MPKAYLLMRITKAYTRSYIATYDSKTIRLITNSFLPFRLDYVDTKQLGFRGGKGSLTAAMTLVLIDAKTSRS